MISEEDQPYAQRKQLDRPFLGLARSLQDASIKAFQSTPEWIKRNLLRPVVGRIATNVIRPDEYTKTLAQNTPSMLDYAKGILYDQPAYGNTLSADYGSRNMERDITASRSLFRGYFDMDPQDTNQIFNKKGKLWSFNPNSAVGAKLGSELQWESEQARQYKTLGNMYTIGRFAPGIPDKWDFNLHPFEQEFYNENPNLPYSKSDYGRQLFEAIGNPVSVQTSYP